MKQIIKYMGASLLLFLILWPFWYLGVLALSYVWRFPSIWPSQWIFTAEVGKLGSPEELVISLLRSLALSASVAALATGLGFWLSKSIAYHRHKRRWLFLAYFPYLIAPVVYAVCLHYYFVYFNWSGSMFGVFWAQMIIVFPFAVIFFTGFWNAKIKALEQLVATLGGNTWQTYRMALFPIARGMLAVCFFQTFLISWFEFGLSNFIGVGKVKTLTILVYQYIREANPALAARASYLLILPPLLLLWINQRFVFNPYSRIV